MQLNAGHEVHQRLAPYLSSSPDTPKMRASVKAVNRIYMLRDYSPLTTLLSMLLLPLMLLPILDGDDVWSTISSQNSPYLPWTQKAISGLSYNTCNKHIHHLSPHWSIAIIKYPSSRFSGQRHVGSPYLPSFPMGPTQITLLICYSFSILRLNTSLFLSQSN